MTKPRQRPPLPGPMKRFTIDLARKRCLGCGGKDQLRVAHRANQEKTKERIKGWENPIFAKTYKWMYADAFHNIGNMSYLCKLCEDRAEQEPAYQDQIDRNWCEAMQRAARSGLLLRYFYNGYARSRANPYAEELKGPGTKAIGLSQDDYGACAPFLEEAAKAGDISSVFVILPEDGDPRSFHYHIDLAHGCMMSHCGADHDECASQFPVWSPAQDIRDQALAKRG